MRTISKMLIVFTMLLTQQVFADDAAPNKDAGSKPCIVIAKACSTAGYVSRRSETKGIWRNCMQPILLGQPVSNVKVDPATVKACRTDKIKELKTQLEQFQQVK